MDPVWLLFLLPVAAAGRIITVINNGANTLEIFPASGDDLGAGVGLSTTIQPNDSGTFTAYDATNWKKTAATGLAYGVMTDFDNTDAY